ncbi:uncharacterized protein FOMMEDRAFT_154510 [Fomitiporia mediterranea MF3/22]|uniref:uncharacterized protein n=1 Tax=Fomitiporia mediterranea (strain MF3/22) TaxID=694068 RepID=UPI0004408164|nr:uncharacterized protein FOMMEDRAFT_154510 [Fomitiporia mediterranea MF3/22]EJD05279.1 hypothetical protein FOMMEDRAFT_154510 [Fomitiporia mediterranea MF3/22]
MSVNIQHEWRQVPPGPYTSATWIYMTRAMIYMLDLGAAAYYPSSYRQASHMQNSKIAQISEGDDSQHESGEHVLESSKRPTSTGPRSVCPFSAMGELTRGSEPQYQFFATETEKFHAEINEPYAARIPNDNIHEHSDPYSENSKNINTHSSPSTPSALLTSYMHRRSSTTTGKRRSSIKEPEDLGTEMDSLHSFAIPTYGDFLSTRVNVHFGRSPNPCTLLFDSGSGRTWVNKAVYKEMTQSEGRRLGIRVQIRYDWPGQSDDICGWLYENSIWFGPGNPVVERFVFAVVDELDQPLVTQLRLQKNIVGMLGFQLAKDPFRVNKSVPAPSVSYLLMKKLAPHLPSISIDFRMPEQAAYQSVDIRRIEVPGCVRIGDPEGNPLGRRNWNWNWHNASKLETSAVTRYDIVFDFARSRIGLAEVEGKTDYVWDELH